MVAGDRVNERLFHGVGWHRGRYIARVSIMAIPISSLVMGGGKKTALWGVGSPVSQNTTGMERKSWDMLYRPTHISQVPHFHLSWCLGIWGIGRQQCQCHRASGPRRTANCLPRTGCISNHCPSLWVYAAGLHADMVGLGIGALLKVHLQGLGR